MRFLVFNVMAALAIAYLVFGGGDNPVTRWIDKPAAQTQDSSALDALNAELQEAKNDLATYQDMPERLAALEDENAELQLALDVIGSQADEAAQQTATIDPKPTNEPTTEPAPETASESTTETQVQQLAGSTESAITPEPLADPGTSEEITFTDADLDGTADSAPQGAPVLLTPKERRRELQLLAQDLEELYINSLN